jgi:hypothetical protein
LRLSYSAASAAIHKVDSPCQLINHRPTVSQYLHRPNITTIISSSSTVLYATKAGSEPPRFDEHDPKEEQKVLEKTIEPHPETVSAESSVRHVFEHSQAKTDGNEMTSGIKSDIQTIKETFTLDEVPKESLYIGAAGVLPYAATSLSTIYLAWDINHAEETGSAFYLFTPETARQLLDIVTPVQIGYGAVVRKHVQILYLTASRTNSL